MQLKVNYSFIFYLLATIILLNLNGVLYLIFNTVGLFSIPIFFLSILLLRLFKFNFTQVNSFKNLFFFYTAYLFIGSLVSPIFNDMITGEKYTQTIFDIFKSIIIILSVFSYLSYHYKTYGSTKKIFDFVGFLVIISIILSYVAHVLDLEKLSSGYRTLQRMSGVFANPNELGTQIVFSIIFTIYFLENSKNFFLKVFLISFLIIALQSLFLAFSRSSFLQIFIITILYFIFKIISGKVRFLLVLPIIYLSVSILFTFVYNEMNISQRKRVDSSLGLLTGEGVSDDNTGGRLYLAEAALEYYYEQPFFGKGIGFMQKMEDVGGVHNSYIAVLGNAGGFVLILFCISLISIVQESYLIYRLTNNYVYLFLIIAVIINGLTKTGVYEFKINNFIFGLVFSKLYEIYYNSRKLSYENFVRN